MKSKVIIETVYRNLGFVCGSYLIIMNFWPGQKFKNNFCV